MRGGLTQGPDGRWVWRYDPVFRVPGPPGTAGRAPMVVLRRRLAEVACPMLFLAGAESWMVEPTTRMATANPRARMVTVPAGGPLGAAGQPRRLPRGGARVPGRGGVMPAPLSPPRLRPNGGGRCPTHQPRVRSAPRSCSMLGPPKPRRLSEPERRLAGATQSAARPGGARPRVPSRRSRRPRAPEPPAAAPRLRPDRQPYDALGERHLCKSRVLWIRAQLMTARGRPSDRGADVGAARAHPRHRGNPLAAGDRLEPVPTGRRPWHSEANEIKWSVSTTVNTRPY